MKAMKVMINGSNQVFDLVLVTLEASDGTADFIGTNGGIENGDFSVTTDGVWVAKDLETFQWWESIIGKYSDLNMRVMWLEMEYGDDDVFEIVEENTYSDMAQTLLEINRALDEKFGSGVGVHPYEKTRIELE